jgi:hypothetical protein
MPHRRSPPPTSTLCLSCCQIKAWKAGHKGECTAAARADTRTAAKPTADQMRVLEVLHQLTVAADWRGVAAQERAARALAAAMLPTGGAWLRRSARPGRWQRPCGCQRRAMRLPAPGHAAASAGLCLDCLLDPRHRI